MRDGVERTDDDYGRRLSLRLDGFAPDGKKIFGILSEGAKIPTTMLFDYDIPSDKVQLIDLAKQSAGAVSADCSTAFDAACQNLSPE